jgi:hypothetical protein
MGVSLKVENSTNAEFKFFQRKLELRMQKRNLDTERLDFFSVNAIRVAEALREVQIIHILDRTIPDARVVGSEDEE